MAFFSRLGGLLPRKALLALSLLVSAVLLTACNQSDTVSYGEVTGKHQDQHGDYYVNLRDCETRDDSGECRTGTVGLPAEIYFQIEMGDTYVNDNPNY